MSVVVNRACIKCQSRKGECRYEYTFEVVILRIFNETTVLECIYENIQEVVISVMI